MKKGLFLLTSLVITGTAISPTLINQNNIKDTTVKSSDIVDLTLPIWTAAKAELPNLVKMLNQNFTPGNPSLLKSAVTLTNTKKQTIAWTSQGFDTSTLRNILSKENAKFNKVKIEVDGGFKRGFVTAYWTQNEKTDIKVIARFTWQNEWDMSSFLTKDVKVGFELTF